MISTMMMTIMMMTRVHVQTYPHYRLVITGHSLGAGTAVLLTMLLRAAFPSVICYAYGYVASSVRYASRLCIMSDNLYVTHFRTPCSVVDVDTAKGEKYLYSCLRSERNVDIYDILILSLPVSIDNRVQWLCDIILSRQ